MNCKNCSYQLPEAAKFCPECGQKVAVSGNSSNGENTSLASKQESFTKPVHAFGLIIAAVSIAIVIVMLILDSNRETTEEKKDISGNTSEISPEVKAKLEELAANPESIALNIELGNMLFDINRFSEAIPFYQKAMNLEPSNIGVQIDLAVCFFNLRNFDQAIVEMEKALQIDPNHPKGLFNMGIVYYNLGKFEEVRKYWQKLMIIHPESLEASRARELLQSLDN
jgi:tetratricopeptide (TPR) repeat protein